MSAPHYVALSAALTWIMIMVAAELHTPTWTRDGARLAFGNRAQLPPRTPLAARADRAAKNMVENLVVLVALFAAAHAVRADATVGTAVFFVARAAYFPVYLAGIPYLRSVIWGASVVGLALVGWAVLRA
jgi:uncharacterized MAPEG superfamily protein